MKYLLLILAVLQVALLARAQQAPLDAVSWEVPYKHEWFFVQYNHTTSQAELCSTRPSTLSSQGQRPLNISCRPGIDCYVVPSDLCNTGMWKDTCVLSAQVYHVVRHWRWMMCRFAKISSFDYNQIPQSLIASLTATDASGDGSAGLMIPVIFKDLKGKVTGQGEKYWPLPKHQVGTPPLPWNDKGASS
ncbi:uncharacterized protein PFL1_05887 [Pseudozyma flocculosa PF-1]|uniref:Uncharacterized protein n=1 Tax=Pseudozyma flocculosa PF-1 TaxID=1277687 RepID=A0A061H7L3_9BASI|nr:uncharacterized protein PFL1_05887 [Pseudozyma flocculosa PF-1]EPQ26566.1 hypothetical protein PFL1_05887 [Pseudozyma flocculosa PF-1]